MRAQLSSQKAAYSTLVSAIAKLFTAVSPAAQQNRAAKIQSIENAL